MKNIVDDYVEANSKGHIAGFLLTLLFGPLGLFYCNWVAGLILTLVAVFYASTIVIPILCWIASIILSSFMVSGHNEKLRTKAILLYGNTHVFMW